MHTKKESNFNAHTINSTGCAEKGVIYNTTSY